MRHIRILLVASVAATPLMTGAAHAQSTGSIDFEEAIVITGSRVSDVGGVRAPDTSKAQLVLEEDAIRRQRPGQTANDIINLVPGVSFQNNDPWGSSGGSFTVRGFGSDRVSQTVDGIPLNDSGNYALYTNQQVDSEVLEQINVNLGVTDVDSPTASATGGTINMRTRVPSDDFKVTLTLSYGNVLASGAGSRPYTRGFAMVDTGDFTGVGTKAFFSASQTNYENPFNNYGEVSKQQYNARLYQELGNGSDFVSIAGHYNQNRNNFFGSFSLSDLQALIDAGDKEGRFYEINFPCSIPVTQLGGGQGAGTPGVADTWSDSSSSGNCGVEFDRRYNPSNTGNIRGSSRFTLADGLVLTVDPSYQYVKANGGGVEDLREGFANRGGVNYTGFISGGYYYGMDLNGDGDLLDRVAGLDPSQTRTHRFGVIASLAFEINRQHRLRLAYTWDRANHRQTGQTTYLKQNGEPFDVFPVNDPIVTSSGFALNKRDRQSYAILHQVSGEYRGRFMDDALTVNLGLRAPFFTRDLQQNCFTTSASGFVDCLGNQDTTAYAAANPTYAPPQHRIYKYEKLLPSVGLVFDLSSASSVFFNFAQGLSVPGTDPLYDSFFIPGSFEARPKAETTDSFDLGFRARSGSVQAQIAAWYTGYNNRLATAYDPVLDEYLYRNLGQVKKYGLDASIAWYPTPDTLLYVFGSINKSEIKDNIADGEICDAGDAADPQFVCVGGAGGDRFLATAGKRESGTPDFSIGARGQVRLGDFDIGAQVKYTGERFANDVNLASVDGYTLVDADIRWNITEDPTMGGIALQLNVTNIFDTFYVGGFGGSLDGSPFVQIGPPRAASLSLIIGY